MTNDIGRTKQVLRKALGVECGTWGDAAAAAAKDTAIAAAMGSAVARAATTAV